MRALLLLAAALACSSCSIIEQPSGLIPRWTLAWKDVATAGDKVRLRDWRNSFTAALAEATKAGHAADIAREGALLQPDAALGGEPVPDGMFRCRVIKLGAREETNLPFVEYPPAICRIRPERGLQRLNKMSGPQRYVGLVFPGDAVRQVFLGTLVLSDEKRALQYGQDQARDVAGYVERIGPQRWRLLMPKPRYESKFDVMELVPLNSAAR